MKENLNTNNILYTEIQPGQYSFTIPRNFEKNIQYNLKYYKLSDLVISAENRTRQTHGEAFLHAPKARAALKNGIQGERGLDFSGPFPTAYYLIERILCVPS